MSHEQSIDPPEATNSLADEATPEKSVETTGLVGVGAGGMPEEGGVATASARPFSVSSAETSSNPFTTLGAMLAKFLLHWKDHQQRIELPDALAVYARLIGLRSYLLVGELKQLGRIAVRGLFALALSFGLTYAAIAGTRVWRSSARSAPIVDGELTSSSSDQPEDSSASGGRLPAAHPTSGEKSPTDSSKSMAMENGAPSPVPTPSPTPTPAPPPTLVDLDIQVMGGAGDSFIPLSGATVRLDESSGTAPRSGVSDSHGAIHLTGLQPGPFRASVSAPCHVRGAIEGALTGGGPGNSASSASIQLLEDGFCAPGSSELAGVQASRALMLVGRMDLYLDRPVPDELLQNAAPSTLELLIAEVGCRYGKTPKSPAESAWCLDQPWFPAAKEAGAKRLSRQALSNQALLKRTLLAQDVDVEDSTTTMPVPERDGKIQRASPGDELPVKFNSISSARDCRQGDEETACAPRFMLDDNPLTAWCEGESGWGKGLRFRADFGSEATVKGLQILSGMYESNTKRVDKGFPKVITLRSGDWNQVLTLAQREGSPVTIRLPTPIQTDSIEIELTDIDHKSRFWDQETCIAELKLFGSMP